jgi:phosphomannomutase
MRVTYLNKYWYPHLGGVEYILRDIAEGVAARTGWSCRAIVANEGAETVSETVGGVEVTRLSRSFAYASTPVAFGMAGAIRADGIKFLLPDDAWLLMRASGTEPLVRIYAEASSLGVVDDLLAAGRALAEADAG